LSAAVVVLAEVADAVIELVREREDDWLADLRGRLEPAREKRREAQRLLDEAKAEEWGIHRLGMWVQVTSQDGAFGRQPSPTIEPPPEPAVRRGPQGEGCRLAGRWVLDREGGCHGEDQSPNAKSWSSLGRPTS
jgi:hypothetical protein